MRDGAFRSFRCYNKLVTTRKDRWSMVRILRNGEKDDGMFDLEFWERVGAEGRFEEALDMLTMPEMMRGLDPIPPRLDRSLLRVVRR